MSIICIDTETYYSDDCTVKTLGPRNYARHPHWDCYMVSIESDDGLSFVGKPEDAPWEQVFREDNTLLSHNTAFDQAMLERLHEQGRIPAPVYKVWEDTADLAAYLGVPRNLKGAAKALLGVEMSKDVRNNMKGKRPEDLSEEKLAALIEYAKLDAVNSLQIWLKYSHEWPEHERALSRHTRDMGRAGLPIDEPQLDKGIENLVGLRSEALAKIPWVEPDNPESKPLSRSLLEAECAAHGVVVPKSLDKNSAECQKWEEEFGEKFPFIAGIRDFRRTNMFLEKLLAIKDRMQPDGTSEFSLKYFGGHTGRWSGEGGVNYQNLPRDEMFGVNLRNLIRAPEGKTFVIADLAQIEARVTLWFAQDWETLELVRSGMDLYEAHARATMGYDDPMVLKDYDKLNGTKIRQLAKARVLGLGFGCGGAKFVDVARIMGGLDLSEDEAVKTVAEYRATNRRIVALWRKLEGHMKSHAGLKMPCEYELPSGRRMRYHDVRFSGELSAVICKTGVFQRNRFWGGVLTENIVQAASRDILAYMAGQLAARGLDIRLHIHDEIVCLADESAAEETQRTMLSVMSSAPAWMGNLPVAAESEITKLYKK